MDEVSRKLGELVAAIAGPRQVTPGDALFHDLGIAGDDAAELLDRVHEQFGTSFEGFRFSDYFPDETEALEAHWLRIGREAKARLTMAHLKQVVRAGRWFDP